MTYDLTECVATMAFIHSEKHCYFFVITYNLVKRALVETIPVWRLTVGDLTVCIFVSELCVRVFQYQILKATMDKA